MNKLYLLWVFQVKIVFQQSLINLEGYFEKAGGSENYDLFYPVLEFKSTFS